MSETAAGDALREARAAWQRGDAAPPNRIAAARSSSTPATGAPGRCSASRCASAIRAEAEAALRRAAVIGPRDPDRALPPRQPVARAGPCPRRRSNRTSARSRSRRTIRACSTTTLSRSTRRARPSAHKRVPPHTRHAPRSPAGAAQPGAFALRRAPLSRGRRRIARTICGCTRKAMPPSWIDQGICQHAAGDDAAAEASFRRALVARAGRCGGADQPGVGIDRPRRLRRRRAAARARAVANDPQFLYAACVARLLPPASMRLGRARLRCTRAWCRASSRTTSALVNAFAALSVPMSAANQLRAARRWAQSLAPPAAGRRAGAATTRLGVATGLRLVRLSHPCGGIPGDRSLGAPRSRAIRDPRVFDRAAGRLAARRARRRRVLPLHRLQRRGARRHGAAHPRRRHRHPDRPQRLHDACAKRDLCAAAGAGADQLAGLSRHAGRAVVRLCDHRSLRHTR